MIYSYDQNDKHHLILATQEALYTLRNFLYSTFPHVMFVVPIFYNIL